VEGVAGGRRYASSMFLHKPGEGWHKGRRIRSRQAGGRRQVAGGGMVSTSAAGPAGNPVKVSAVCPGRWRGGGIGGRERGQNGYGGGGGRW